MGTSRSVLVVVEVAEEEVVVVVVVVLSVGRWVGAAAAAAAAAAKLKHSPLNNTGLSLGHSGSSGLRAESIVDGSGMAADGSLLLSDSHEGARALV